MSTGNDTSWLSGLKSDYKSVFVDEWPPYLGGILIMLFIIGLMLSGLFWGVFGGLRLWGNWFNNFIGLGPMLGIPEQLASPLLHRISLMDITLVLGSMSAALMSRQFAINRPPKLEYIWAALGGSLMGIGASLAGGCTVGGLFTPILHYSPAGWMMLLGLTIGAVVGLKLLLWTLEHIEWGMTAPPVIKPPARVVAMYPLLGLGLVVIIMLWAIGWYASDNERLVARAVIILAGFSIGFILHRSRLCFARAIREPFMTGEGQMTRALILALAIGLPLTALFFNKGLIDPYMAIPPTFWLGSLVGGLIFGVGMVFAGGCASGSMWRMGEGHLKLWVAVFFFSWVGSIASALFRKTGLFVSEMNLDLIEETKVGFQAYFPVMFEGWGWALLVSGVILLIWYLLIRYNESTEKFTVL